jgi:hypothetical protein
VASKTQTVCTLAVSFFRGGGGRAGKRRSAPGQSNVTPILLPNLRRRSLCP